MILALMAVIGAWALAWGGLGFLVDPLWWISLLVPGVWAAGLALRSRWTCSLGLVVTISLACGVGIAGSLSSALGVAALALWGWDVGLLWISRLQYANPEITRRLGRATLVRSTALCAASFLIALGFATIRVAVPFWWLVGAALTVWAGLVLVVRGLARDQRAGGEASGNRSSSDRETA